MSEPKNLKTTDIPLQDRLRRPIGGFGPGPHMVSAGPGVKPKDTRKTLKRLWGYLQHRKTILILVFLMVLVTSLLMLTGPYLIGKAIDDYIIPKDFKGLYLKSLNIFLFSFSKFNIYSKFFDLISSIIS